MPNNDDTQDPITTTNPPPKPSAAMSVLFGGSPKPAAGAVEPTGVDKPADDQDE